MSTTWTPERLEKFRATMAAKKVERDKHTTALKKFVAKKRKPKARKVTTIPLDMIPDNTPVLRKKRIASNGISTEQAALWIIKLASSMLKGPR